MRCLNRYISLLLACGLVVLPFAAQAISLIRDAEIEDTLRAYTNPIFKSAGLNPNAIHIFIVDDPTINAYVAGGSNMFIHTGLILKTESPSMLIGVMAHETGHMAGGHLAQGTEKLKNAQLGAILSAVLGAAIAAGGGADAGMAMIAAGQQVAMRNYLSFSRSNENAADQAALDYLDTLGISAAGLLHMMEILRQNENRSYGVPDPYTRTHPLSIDRITHIRNHVMQSSITEDAIPANFKERHARMLAKLGGFINPPEQTLLLYPVQDKSIPARYARAIAYYKMPDIKKSLAELEGLIKERPRDPFFYELQGQICFENNRITEAQQAYAQAAKLLPHSPLILSDYGRILIASDDPVNIEKAIKILERATVLDNSNPNTWHDLAMGYGKLNHLGMYYLATAEMASLEDNPKEVVHNIELALKSSDLDSPSRLRAADLKSLAEKELQEKKNESSSVLGR